jgi:DNA-binding CsgD family transcriptional regulator
MHANKPQIPTTILLRWQRLVDIMGNITDTPAALITRLLPDAIEMLVRNQHSQNPYKANELSPRRCGLYCDSVVETKLPLLVSDAAQDLLWQDNPDMEHALSFYLGYPLRWPDGEVFGTLCVLDKQDNFRAKKYRDLIEEFQSLVNSDLAFIYQQHLHRQNYLQLEQTLTQQQLEMRDRAHDLTEINTAMRVLLNHREQDKNSLKAELLTEIQQLVKPWLIKLERTSLQQDQRQYLNRIRDHLRDSKGISHQLYFDLTAMEQQVAKAVSQGLSSKVIAQQMYLEKSTIDFHRRNIRQKLGLVSSKMSLKQFLLELNLQ